MRYFNRFLSIAAIAVLGFIRDYLFVHLNYRLSSLYYKNFSYGLPRPLFFLESADYMQLYYLKYFFTGLSFILFFLLSCWAVYSFFSEKKYLKWVLYSYIIVILAGGLTFVSLYWFLGFDKTYLFVRHFIDLAESPVLAMIMITGIYLHKKLHSEKNTSV